jgi:hypothetical protein
VSGCGKTGNTRLSRPDLLFSVDVLWADKNLKGWCHEINLILANN